MLDAVRHGSLVVAAQGEDRFGGSPQTFPADEAHVLTVVATDREAPSTSTPTARSRTTSPRPASRSRSPCRSSASPSGYQTVTARATRRPSSPGQRPGSGRNGRRSTRVSSSSCSSAARGRSLPAYNSVSGYGELDLRAALAAPTPPGDPFEPNDDVGHGPSRRPVPGRHAVTDEPAPEDRVHPWLAGPERGSARRVPRLDPAPRKPRRNGHAASGGDHVASLAREHPQRARGGRTTAARPARDRAGHGRRTVCASRTAARRGMYAYLEISIGSAQNSSYALALSTHSAP